MKNIFTNHPHSVNESYFQHLRHALYFGGSMVIGGTACIIHAFLPFLFPKTGSQILVNLSHFFITRMTTVDEKVIELGHLIEKKSKQQ